MIPRIKEAIAKEDYQLYVTFEDGTSVLYDVKDDIQEIEDFRLLTEQTGLFQNFAIDESRTVISWSDKIDLPSDTIKEYGIAK